MITAWMPVRSARADVRASCADLSVARRRRIFAASAGPDVAAVALITRPPFCVPACVPVTFAPRNRTKMKATRKMMMKVMVDRAEAALKPCLIWLTTRIDSVRRRMPGPAAR